LRLLVGKRKKEEGRGGREEEQVVCVVERKLGLVRATAPSSQSSDITGQWLTEEAFCVPAPPEQQQMWVSSSWLLERKEKFAWDGFQGSCSAGRAISEVGKGHIITLG